MMKPDDICRCGDFYEDHCGLLGSCTVCGPELCPKFELAGMTQIAPYPSLLVDLVERCTYRPGWSVRMLDNGYDRGQGSIGMTLVITTDTVNSYPPHDPLRVNHLFIVPAASYDERSWRRWLFERFHDVELHECMEFFTINEQKPYAPSHGPGNDPYLVREVGTDVDQRTSFRGEINP